MISCSGEYTGVGKSRFTVHKKMKVMIITVALLTLL